MSLNINAKETSFAGNLAHVGETIFSVVNNWVKQHGALNLSQGFPDFEAHPNLVALVHQKMAEGFNQYAPSPGDLGLRKVLADITQEDYQAHYDPNTEVTITAGATQAIATVIATTIREGDEVILLSPAYDCYAPMIQLHGGVPKYLNLSFPEYKVDWDKLLKMITHKTKMLIINTPHNPSGSILDEEDLNWLEKIASKSNILILSDEVYENIIFQGKKHCSVRTRPSLKARSFVVGSLGKTLHVTGWKVGYIMAPAHFTEEIRKVHQYLVFSVNTPVQMALAEFLKDEQNRAVQDFYEEKQQYFLQQIEGSKFKALPSFGGYFQLLDYSQISDKPDMDFVKWLIEEHKIACIPLSVFYPDKEDNKVIRFCFAKNDETLKRAGEILRAI